MRGLIAVPTIRVVTLVGIVSCILLAGCNRAFYREQADRDVDCMIAEKSNDPRWMVNNFTIAIDPRSRYFDQYNPDCPPMPPDDPASHQYMHCVNGMKGWKGWHRMYGTRSELENPGWRAMMASYVPMNEKGEVILSLETSLQLAYLHSPEYQQVLETLYLSALDVTTERFRLDTQFFGGTGTTYAHLGRLRPGGESNRLTTATDFQMRRRFATAGELLVGFANSFVWQFAGPNTNSSLSILNFNFVQPLLRAAGRDIGLEQLTIVERGLLANVRAFHQFRQGFFTDVAIGEAGVQGPQRRGGFFGGTGLTGFTGTGAGGLGGVGQATGFGRGGFGATGGATGSGAGFAGGGAGAVGGYIGLLQSLQEIRNTRTSLNSQLRTLGLLEASLDAGVIDLTQVDQFRQAIETERATLLQAENGLLNSLETFKRTTLGLPPDLPVTLDDTLIEPFQLIDSSTVELQDAIADLQEGLGKFEDGPTMENVDAMLESVASIEDDFKATLDNVGKDLEMLEEVIPQRLESEESPADIARLKSDLMQLPKSFDSMSKRFDDLVAERNRLAVGAATAQPRVTADDLVVWLRSLLSLTQELSLIQARARLESVLVDPVDLDSDTAFQIALENRLDIMNNRAALVDSWRLIQFNADALQSQLDVFFEGDLQTVGDNPVKFRAPAGSMRAGVRFDAPFTRLVERNNYRQQLIEYQQDRRQFIQSLDGVHQSMRSLLRELTQLRVNLEIQRRAVVIAIRRVDVTREDLNEPQPPSEPGQPASQLGPTAATSLLTALSDLRNVQNNFMSVYLNYYAGRMRLARDLGLMQIDEQGRWVETPVPESIPMGRDSIESDEELVPPPVPDNVMEYINEMMDETTPPAIPTDAASVPIAPNPTSFQPSTAGL